ncbi:MAG: galactokinase [Treponema sp.]|jgi:galactokinase|nr:galactokinase [Treponema sp.]
MNEKELLNKIDSDSAAGIFSELYGKDEIDAARQRYRKLITEMPKGQINETEKLRVFSAPGRTELAGNHTDHNRGKVLAASIQLDSVAIVQKRNDNRVFFRSTGYPDVVVDLKDSSGASDLLPKHIEEGTTEALVRGIAAELNRRNGKPGDYTIGGFSANATSTVLPGSGLSSSAAVEVLIGRIFDSLYPQQFSEHGEGKRSALEIAQIGQIAENVYFGKPCGLMDQTACASGGVVAIDFANAVCPSVKQINFDPAAAGYALCVVDSGGSHADLTPDYASIPAEMKKAAAFFGKSVLGELEKEVFLSSASEIRKASGDRAFLRSLHFFDENIRVEAMASILNEMENAATHSAKQQAMFAFLDLVNQSGDSSWQLLQNVYSAQYLDSQGICVALALTKEFLQKQKLQGACRVHGGGFAGTIQVYLPLDAINAYKTKMEKVFGAGSVTPLRIRPVGAIELTF